MVHHRPSGKTHFLNSASSLLLREILLDPMDPETASAHLAAAQGSDPEPEFEEYVAGLLIRFEELGLVERVAA